MTEKLRTEFKKNNSFIEGMCLKTPIRAIVKKFPKLEYHMDELELVYKIFLYCCMMGAKYNIPLYGPGDVIDELWHCHILHSEQYHFQCNKIFGSYLHHCPEESMSEKKVGESGFLTIINLLVAKGHDWLKLSIPFIKIFMDTRLIKCECSTNVNHIS